MKERSEHAVFVESFGLDTFRISELHILAEWTAKIESRLGASARNNGSWHPGARWPPVTTGQIVIYRDGQPFGADQSEALGIAQVPQEAKRLTSTKRPQGGQQAACRFSAILDASLQVHGNGALS